MNLTFHGHPPVPDAIRSLSSFLVVLFKLLFCYCMVFSSPGAVRPEHGPKRFAPFLARQKSQQQVPSVVQEDELNKK